MHAPAVFLTAALLLAATSSAPHAQQGHASGAGESEIAAGMTILMPTSHPPLPRELSLVWLAPDRTSTGRSQTSATIGNVARLVSDGEYSKAFSIASQSSLRQGPLAQYAAYYAGIAQLRLDRPADALKTFRALRDQKPLGYLAEAAAMGEADASLALNNPAAAVSIYKRLSTSKPSNLEDVLLRLGRASKVAGDMDGAADAFARVYYEFALSDLAPEAGTELAVLNLRAVTPGSPRFELELGRAERLFGARQYPAARTAYERLESFATGDDRELVQLRLAECDYYQGKFRDARAGVKPILGGRVSRQAEALYFYAVSSRDAGDTSTYLDVARRIVSEFPDDSWAEETLNSLGTYYILKDDDERADDVFRELYEKFPKGTYAERAAWKAGWRAYRQRQFDDTVRFFERAASDFPRSDYRPSWLYWAGRAREQLSDLPEARQRYAIVVADYLNSYYGRLAAARLGGSAEADAHAVGVSAVVDQKGAASPPLPQNAAIIRALLGADMFDDALNELRYARRVWGDSPAIQATIAWTNQQQSRTESGMRRFQLVRGAMNTMRRAYPQFMAAGGEDLPHDVLTVIYPLAYWDLIRRQATLNGLDPYLVAALVAQESTFVADIRSHANAYGLMQLMPATARQYARKLKIPYSSRILTDPEANVRIGTAYFADKIKEFGSAHLALASYNAGEGPVRQWMAERQGIERDEFIDDIPYPETQGYVRKILGTAEDYRRLYGAGEADKDGVDKTPVADVKATEAAAPVVKAPAKRVPKPKVMPTPRQKRAPKAHAPKTRKR
jgi:soluble lytic murein transglycosylase